MDAWLIDIESFEAISQDATAKRLVLRMAHLSREGRLEPFIDALSTDPDLDESTKDAFLEMAENETFLLAVEEYLGRTQRLH